MTTRSEKFMLVAFGICLFVLAIAGVFATVNSTVRMFVKSEPQIAAEVVKCTRCGKTCDKSTMTAYKSVGKADILLCQKCVYDQAESFLKFCPVEE